MRNDILFYDLCTVFDLEYVFNSLLRFLLYLKSAMIPLVMEILECYIAKTVFLFIFEFIISLDIEKYFLPDRLRLLIELPCFNLMDSSFNASLGFLLGLMCCSSSLNLHASKRHILLSTSRGKNLLHQFILPQGVI